MKGGTNGDILVLMVVFGLFTGLLGVIGGRWADAEDRERWAEERGRESEKQQEHEAAETTEKCYARGCNNYKVDDSGTCEWHKTHCWTHGCDKPIAEPKHAVCEEHWCNYVTAYVSPPMDGLRRCRWGTMKDSLYCSEHTCLVEGCQKPTITNGRVPLRTGVCEWHKPQSYELSNTCCVEECSKPRVKGFWLCKDHLDQLNVKYEGSPSDEADDIDNG